MKISSQGVVFAGGSYSNYNSCAFPQICILPEGRWLCAFGAGPYKLATSQRAALITWSDDQGQSWSKPQACFPKMPIGGKSGIFPSCAVTALNEKRVLAVLSWIDNSDMSLPFFNEDTEGLLDTKILVADSYDQGQSWSEPRLVDTSPFNVPTPITGPVLALANGELACQFELNKHYYDQSEWNHSSVLLFSTDKGMTWGKYAIASNDPINRRFYWDQRPAVLSDGTVFDLFWTYDRQSSAYLNIHASESTDNGHSWSEMWDTGVAGQPAPSVSLPDGRIAMVFVNRDERPTIRFRISGDGGRSWPQENESILYCQDSPPETLPKKTMQDAWTEMGKFSVGFPMTAKLPSGDIVVVFYAGSHCDLTDIRWVRINVADLP